MGGAPKDVLCSPLESLEWAGAVRSETEGADGECDGDGQKHRGVLVARSQASHQGRRTGLYATAPACKADEQPQEGGTQGVVEREDLVRDGVAPHQRRQSKRQRGPRASSRRSPLNASTVE